MKEYKHNLTLSNAMVCINCEHIFSGYERFDSCPKCLSTQIVVLANWLKATEEPNKEKELAHDY